MAGIGGGYWGAGYYAQGFFATGFWRETAVLVPIGVVAATTEPSRAEAVLVRSGAGEAEDVVPSGQRASGPVLSHGRATLATAGRSSIERRLVGRAWASRRGEGRVSRKAPIGARTQALRRLAARAAADDSIEETGLATEEKSGRAEAEMAQPSGLSQGNLAPGLPGEG